MKATLINKSTIVLIDGNYRYTIKRTGSGNKDFALKKDRLDVDEDVDIFDDDEATEEDGDDEA